MMTNEITRVPITVHRTPVDLGGKFPEPIREWLNNEFGTVRTLMIEGKPWFMAVDVAKILEYTNSRKAIKDHVQPQDKQTIDISTVTNSYGWNPKRVIINEVGMYSLIFHSRMPKAQEFAHWVCEEVLPSIRKHGAYLTPGTLEDVRSKPEKLQHLVEELEQERQLRMKLEDEVKELKPLADYTKEVLQSDELLTVTLVAKEFGLTAQKLNQVLHEHHLIFKLTRKNGRSCWHVYNEYVKKGWFGYKTHKYADHSNNTRSTTHQYITQAGRQKLHELLPAWGYARLNNAV